ALGGARAREQVPLVIAVEMDLVARGTGAVALQQLGLDVGLARGRSEGLTPVLCREDFVDLGARLHHAGPAYECRHAVAALPVGVLFAAERRGAAVGPSERLRTVVGGIDHDRVVGDAEVVELLQELADLPVVLDHAVGIDAEPGLALGRGLETGPDVHAGGVEPHEERLLVPACAVDEVARSLKELLVCSLHALLVEGAGVGAVLLAPLAESRIFAWRLDGRRRAPEHAARAEAQLELCALRVVRVLRLVLGVEVVEIAEELVEAVHGGEELVAVPEMILAALSR